MAEFDDSDELARFKNWWSNNGRSLIVGVVVGLVIVAGWYGWGWYQDRQARQAAQLYGQVSQALGQEKLSAGATEAIDKLKADYPKTPYTTSAVMTLGRYRLVHGASDQAAEQFGWVVEYAGDAGLRSLARARQARAIWNQGQSDKALALLEDHDSTPGFASLYAEIKGDILLAQDKKEPAHSAYETARAKRSSYAPTAQLEAKLNSTASTQTGADADSTSASSSS